MSKQLREVPTTIMPIEQKLLLVQEAASALKTNTNTVYKLIREGKLRALKLGRLKVPVFEIDRFLHENLGEDLSRYIC